MIRCDTEKKVAEKYHFCTLLLRRLPAGARRRCADRRDALQGAGRRVRAWKPRQHLRRQPLGLRGS